MAEQNVALYQPQAILKGDELEALYRSCAGIYKGNLYPDCKSPEQVFAKVMAGRDLGLSMTQALTGIHMVQGRPTVAATLLASFVQRRPDLDYRVRAITNDGCEIEFFRDGESVGVSSFTIEDAKQAGLAGKDNYKHFPRNMLFARALSNGVRWFCPDATAGIPVYVEGEIESDRVIDGQPASGAEGGTEVTLSAVAEDIPADLRDRFYAAYGEAADLRPGQLNPAAVGMTVRGQSRERVLEFLEVVEAANEAARAAASDVDDGEGVEDAEVVPDEPVEESAVESLRRQLADLEALQVDLEENPGDFAETSAELDRISVEMDRIEAEIEAVESTDQGRLL